MYYSISELESLGLKSFGTNVLLSKKTSLYNPSNIEIGSNVRIDDFCILSAGEKGIVIGSYVHIACYCLLIGAEKIVMKDFSGLSSRVSIYSSTDDYSGDCLTNPTTPVEYRNVISKPVTLEKHVIIGASSVILPGVTLHEGVAAGANCLITKSFKPFSILFGSPAKIIKQRSKKLLELENYVSLSRS
jgi:galactoside O-acetyltransferase